MAARNKKASGLLDLQWTSRDGRTQAVKDMDGTHLKNALALCQRELKRRSDLNAVLLQFENMQCTDAEKTFATLTGQRNDLIIEVCKKYIKAFEAAIEELDDDDDDTGW